MIWDALGLQGRRYPAALSDTGDAVFNVEVERGVGSRIPVVGERNADARIAIEKFHPEFFSFSAETFSSRLALLVDRDSSIEPAIIYLIRNPLAVMWSIARYKRRDSTWYPWLTHDQIPVFVARTLKTLSALASKRAGLICDYDDLQVNDESVARLFRFVDPSLADSASEYVEVARATNSREAKQRKQRRPFLGGQMKRQLLDSSGPDGAWSDQQDSIHQALEIYETMLTRSHQIPTDS
jgi:hypothetical protein